MEQRTRPSMDDTDEHFSIEKVDPLCPNAMQLLQAFRAEMMARYWESDGFRQARPLLSPKWDPGAFVCF